MEHCPECNSVKIEQKLEGKICGECGLVIDEGYYSGRMLVV